MTNSLTWRHGGDLFPRHGCPPLEKPTRSLIEVLPISPIHTRVRDLKEGAFQVFVSLLSIDIMHK